MSTKLRYWCLSRLVLVAPGGCLYPASRFLFLSLFHSLLPHSCLLTPNRLSFPHTPHTLCQNPDTLHNAHSLHTFSSFHHDHDRTHTHDHGTHDWHSVLKLSSPTQHPRSTSAILTPLRSQTAIPKTSRFIASDYDQLQCRR